MQNSFDGLNTLIQTTVTTYAAGTVMNKNFADITALQDALTAANQSGTAPPSNGGSNGGGASGGGAGEFVPGRGGGSGSPIPGQRRTDYAAGGGSGASAPTGR